MNDLSRKALLAVLEHDGVDEIVRPKAQVRAMRRELVLMKRAWVGPHYSMLTPGCFLLFMEDFTRIIGSSALGTLIDTKMRFAFESLAPDHFATPLESLSCLVILLLTGSVSFASASVSPFRTTSKRPTSSSTQGSCCVF
jgi:hypothetical protein